MQPGLTRRRLLLAGVGLGAAAGVAYRATSDNPAQLRPPGALPPAEFLEQLPKFLEKCLCHDVLAMAGNVDRDRDNAIGKPLDRQAGRFGRCVRHGESVLSGNFGSGSVCWLHAVRLPLGQKPLVYREF